MQEIVFDKNISLKYSDEFKVMSDEENERYFTGNLQRLSFINKEKHMLLSLSKSKDSIFNRFLGVVAVIHNSISNLENNLKNFKLLEEFDSTIIGEPTVTECFFLYSK